MSKIEWTDKTWNPIAGCSKVSEGCKNCYAEKAAASPRLKQFTKYDGVVDEHGNWTGKINLDEKKLIEPFKWKTPRRVFVNSMSDLFHENVPDMWIDKIFAVMALCPQHKFQILTKRPERMKTYVEDLEHQSRTFGGIRGASAYGVYMLSEKWDSNFRGGKFSGVLNKAWMDRRDELNYIKWPLPNVWLGVSVENQQTADERILLLLDTPAAVRFLSSEPLLGPVNIKCRYDHNNDGDCHKHLQGCPSVDWVIAGGESGPKARPMHPDWVRTLRAQCETAGVPFFFKQWGEWVPKQVRNYAHAENAGKLVKGQIVASTSSKEVGKIQYHAYPADVPEDGMVDYELMTKIGKKKAGRELDGRTWEEFPA